MADDDLPLPGADGRKVIHVDMDAFFASVEQRDDPSLKGRPVAVGGGHRGVVAAASYEARVFGVRSAMPSVTARRKCPDLVFVKPRFDTYRAVSRQIRTIFEHHTDLIEPLSLDEAYLDVTDDRHGLGTARAIAEDIRARIRSETGLTASAGVSYCKFVAKLASDQNKPDGLCVIPPHKGAAFVATLPVKRFHGVGPKTAERMQALGIRTGADLAAWSLSELHAHFGSSADWYYRIARGIDERPVRSTRQRKSVSCEDTFGVDLADPDSLREELLRIGERAWERVEKADFHGRTVTLKAKFSDFTILTRSKSFGDEIPGKQAFLEAGVQLLDGLFPLPRPIRLLGLGAYTPIATLEGGAMQLGLEF